MEEFLSRSEMGDGEAMKMMMKKPNINPSLPKLSLPSKTYSENLFKNPAEGPSPSPMSFVSSLFADDPDSEHKSFSQLLGSNLSPMNDGMKDSWYLDSNSHTGIRRLSMVKLSFHFFSKCLLIILLVF
mgnify:CR=1 FL=1